ncbi:MAG: radical SAM protein [PVC group bacterium]|nr:radical SAM protein [PVC group bacterium]
MSYTQREEQVRESIEVRKPVAWAKIQQTDQRVKEGKSIALLQLQYRYVCNEVCKHCAIERFKVNLEGRKLTPADVKDIADQAHEYGLFSICISGGEPLIFHDLEQVIDAIGPERFILSMDTNGLALSQHEIKWLVTKGVDRIHLSIDGLQENHDEFRHEEGAWQHNIDMLPYCKQYGLGVVVNIVATKDLVRSREIEEQLEFIQKFGFHASLIYAKPVGNFEEAGDQVLNKKDFAYLETLTKKYNCSTHLTPAYGRDVGCLCFKRHFSILPNGKVLPCPWLPISMGNVLEEKLETIITGSLMNPWFSWKHKHTCHSGNQDSYFYKNVVSQLDELHDLFGYPVDWKLLNWHFEYFRKSSTKITEKGS